MRAMDCGITNIGKITPTESTEVFTVNRSSCSTLNDPKRDLESQSANIDIKKHSIWWTLIIDIPLLLLVGGFIGAFEKSLIPTNKYGFYCNDPALSFKYNGEVVNGDVLMATIFLIPLFLFVIIESIFFVEDYSSKSKLKGILLKTFWLYRNYIYGLLANLAIVEVMKGIVGSPRPVFFDLCDPDTGKTCNRSEFVSKFECTSKFPWWTQMDSYRSFPSGHTALSVYCGFFMAWYLQKRAFDWSHRTVFLVPFLQMLCITFAALCSLTRITDHRHHWWDVLIGAVVAAIALLYSVIAVGNNFSYVTSKDSNDEIRCEGSRQTVRTLLFDERQREIVS